MMRVWAVPAAPSGYDADAQAMFDKRAAFADEPSAAYKQVISDYVTDLKAVPGRWNDITQLVVLAGATAVDGVRQSIKGNDLTATNFVNADINIKTGVKGDGVGKRFSTGYTTASAGGSQNDLHTYAYFSELGTVGRSLFGAGNANAGSWNMAEATNSRANNGSSNTLASAGIGGYGINRSGSANYERMAGSATSTVTRTSDGTQTSTHHILCTTTNNSATPLGGSFSDARILVWILGPSVSSLGDYTTPTQDLVTALNAI